MGWTRRQLLGALAASTGTAALTGAAGAQIAASPLPRPRPTGGGTIDLSAAAARLIDRANLSGQVTFAVADAATGAVSDTRDGDHPMAPASTAKALTAAYAFDALGPGHRFVTRVVATGPLRDGRVEGDLILEGGGDPLASSDTLVLLIDRLREMGVREVSGGLRLWSGALPYVPEIDPKQPDHLGYNPAVSGLNLNYNRVHFQWTKRGADYAMTMDARTERVVPPVSMATVRAVERSVPIYALDRDPDSGVEAWTVARPALGASGARWLPVRDPERYAGEVFRTLAAARGLDLPAAQPLLAPPDGAVPLAAVYGPPLRDVARGMLRFSTNLTAEALGLAASTARTGASPTDLAASAAVMNGWARTVGMEAPGFVDHSGLGDRSRVAPSDMVRALVELGPGGPLWPVLRERGLQDDAGRPEPLTLRAKTGTLNFVSCLAGYIRRPRGAPLAFAVMTADLARRAAIPPGDEERPPGALGWSRRSRALQYDLVRLWARHA